MPLSEDCLFCKIILREIPADIVYEDEQVLAFNDINPSSRADRSERTCPHH